METNNTPGDDPAAGCLGAIKSPEDSRDWIFEGLARGSGYNNELPPRFDLRKHMRPSRDQGIRGTCAAFTACAITEIHKNIGEGIDEWMSPEFIYYHRDNKPASGMYGRNVFQIMKKIGSVPEKHFPYQKSDVRVRNPSGALYICAQNYRIMSYARVKTVDGLRRALFELGPAYLLLPLYKTRPCFWRDDGTICSGGHSTTVVGYNETGFILKNSWGPKWNGDGTVIFPYDEWDVLWECWISINDHDKVVTRRRSSAAAHIDVNEKIEGLKEIDLIDLENYKLAGNSESESPPMVESVSADNLGELDSVGSVNGVDGVDGVDVGGVDVGGVSSVGSVSSINRDVAAANMVGVAGITGVPIVLNAPIVSTNDNSNNTHESSKVPRASVRGRLSLEEPTRGRQPPNQLREKPPRYSLRIPTGKIPIGKKNTPVDGDEGSKCCIM
jgi:Papain family cysteine protease